MMLVEIFERKISRISVHQLVHMWTGLQSFQTRQQLPSLPTARSKEISKYEWLVMNDDGKDKHRLVVLSTDLPSIYACKVLSMFSGVIV